MLVQKIFLLALPFVSMTLANTVGGIPDSGSQNPCHEGKRVENFDCTVITLPVGLCQECLLGPINPFTGNFQDCRVATVITDTCVAKMEEYTDLTPCDTQRAEAVTAYKDDPTDPYALKLIDEFIYGLCENGCDCIPNDDSKRHTPELDFDRRNCYSHAKADACNVFPNVREIRLDDGTRPAPSESDLDEVCPTLRSLLEQGGQIDPPQNVRNFVMGMMDAVEISTKPDYWITCWLFESTQQRIDPLPLQDRFVKLAGASIMFDGIIWEKDDDFAQSGSEASTSSPIALTLRDELYQKARTGTFALGIPVDNGDYDIFIHHAAIDGNTGRSTDVTVEGELKKSGITAPVANTAYIDGPISVTVADGVLDFAFRDASICGLEIIAGGVVPVSVPVPTPVAAPSPVPPAVNGVLRINVGGGTESDPDTGDIWQEDVYCVLSSGKDIDKNRNIDGTNFDELFRSMKKGFFTCDIPANSGVYDVKLYFAEYWNDVADGLKVREFDVDIEGSTVLTAYNVYQQAGNKLDTAVIETISDIAVTDGSLTIDFKKFSDEKAICSGIEVIEK